MFTRASRSTAAAEESSAGLFAGAGVFTTGAASLDAVGVGEAGSAEVVTGVGAAAVDVVAAKFPGGNEATAAVSGCGGGETRARVVVAAGETAGALAEKCGFMNMKSKIPTASAAAAPV